MTKEILSRDLGFFSVIAISMGAMVGAGIFILPGVAAGLAGPAVIIAFVLAGLIALTAALTVSELATAMPMAGGAYIFISRSMGPLMGSIAGWGVWISLILKGSFALVGLSAYLSLFVSLPFTLNIISLLLCMFLLGLNWFGTRAAGQFQMVTITVVLTVLAIFIVLGIPNVNPAHYQNLAPEGAAGLLAATSLVFVSYIGVTKIASVSEEIKRPDKNIPRGIIISLVLMMVLYALVTFVLVGVYPLDQLVATKTPISSVGEVFMGPIGALVIAVIAVFALISMANSAILASTRYPFAMSRDQLMPKWLLKVNARFSTPHNSILLTGMVMLALIAFFDVVSLAKLASAFTILIFVLLHFALLMFRFFRPEGYKPAFRSPFFPYIQFVGIISSTLLVFQMGLLPLFAMIYLVIFGTWWFYFYGKEKVSFKGAFQKVVSFDKEQRIRHRKSAKMDARAIRILIPLNKLKNERDLLLLASWIVKRREALIQVVRIKEMPVQTPFEVVKGFVKGAETEFEQTTHELAQALKLNIETYELLSHDWKQSVVNFAESQGSEMILLDWEEEFYHELMHRSDIHWIMRHAPCDVAVFKDRGLSKVENIMLITASDSYENLKVRMANSLAIANSATVTFFHAMNPRMNWFQRKNIRRYHAMLNRNCSCSSKSKIVMSKDIKAAITNESKNHDLLVIGATTGHALTDTIFGHIEDRVIKNADKSVLILISRHRSHKR